MVDIFLWAIRIIVGCAAAIAFEALMKGISIRAFNFDARLRDVQEKSIAITAIVLAVAFVKALKIGG